MLYQKRPFRNLEPHKKDNRDGRFLVKNEGDKYSLAQIQADIYGQEIDDGFNKADGKRKSKKKSKKVKTKQVNNPATNLYNEVREETLNFRPD